MTNIQWTDVTDNIITVAGGGWWCRKVSPGCANCYAEGVNQNAFYKGNMLPYTGKPPEMVLDREKMSGWARMRSQKKHFVASMTDVFGEWVPKEWHFEMLDAMAAAPKQIFQVLTKRPEIMLVTVAEWIVARGLDEAPANIWLGASIEDQQRFYERSPYMQQIRDLGFKAWYSVEPLLEEVDLHLEESPVDWVVVGGESGKNARPCSIWWIAFIRKAR